MGDADPVASPRSGSDVGGRRGQRRRSRSRSRSCSRDHGRPAGGHRHSASRADTEFPSDDGDGDGDGAVKGVSSALRPSAQSRRSSRSASRRAGRRHHDTRRRSGGGRRRRERETHDTGGRTQERQDRGRKHGRGRDRQRRPSRSRSRSRSTSRSRSRSTSRSMSAASVRDASPRIGRGRAATPESLCARDEHGRAAAGGHWRGGADHVDAVDDAADDAADVVADADAVCQLDDRDLLAALDMQHEYWTQDHDLPDALDWMLGRMRLSVQELTLENINAAREKALAGLYFLFSTCTSRGLIDEHTEEGMEYVRKYVDIKRVISWTHSVLASMEHSRLARLRENVIAPSDALPFGVSCQTPEDAELSDFHKLLQFIMQECQRDNLRKLNGDTYAQIVTEDGHYTHAWKRVGSIKRMIYERIDKETRFEQWLILSSHPGMVNRLVEWISDGNERELPELKPSRYYISFANGVYDVRGDRWLPYGHPALTPDVVSCRYIPQRMRDEIVFSPGFLTRPLSLPTPSFDKIMRDQELPMEVQVWVMAMLGRMLYDLGEKDNWQKILFIQGKAGNGKSTLANVMRSIYEPSNVGILNSNCEAQWALSGIYNKFIWACLEVKAKFRLDTGSLQSIISGESTVVNQKYHDPFDVEWKVPGLLVGNEFPLGWVDVQGALLRRVLLVRFTRRPRDVDPYLMQNIQAELPMLIVKLNRIYAAALAKCDRGSVDDHLPEYFSQTRKQLANQAQPMRALLTSSNTIFALHPERYMMLEELKQLYNDFCRLNNIPAQRFDEDAFKDVCEELGLEVMNVTSGVEYGGVIKYGSFVFGIGYDEASVEAGARERIRAELEALRLEKQQPATADEHVTGDEDSDARSDERGGEDARGVRHRDREADTDEGEEEEDEEEEEQGRERGTALARRQVAVPSQGSGNTRQKRRRGGAEEEDLAVSRDHSSPAGKKGRSGRLTRRAQADPRRATGTTSRGARPGALTEEEAQALGGAL